MNTSTRKRHTRPLWIALTAFFLLASLFFVLVCLPIHGEEEIYDAVIRLHVLANSDSEEDQALKLQVRNTVLQTLEAPLRDCNDRAEAVKTLQPLIPQLQAAAEQTLREHGCSDKVHVTLSEEQYPRRSYDSFCFPAGEYLSLRVMIGAAEGQNFWCVLFPPLCLSAATVEREEAEEEFISVGLSKDQYGIITESKNTKYRLRFKFLEIFNRARK